ncbi:hypothetical protein HY992_06270 [Candidatus Micrarchaeota archaeon]|nr:hypothetical protein [Candidatus Micrarchaeota archaeon]
MVKKKIKLEPRWLDDRISRTMLADSLALAATQRNINMDYDMEERIRKLEDRFQREVRKEKRGKSGTKKAKKPAKAKKIKIPAKIKLKKTGKTCKKPKIKKKTAKAKKAKKKR